MQKNYTPGYKFTDFPLDELFHWLALHYIDDISTVELIKRAGDMFHRQEVVLVSLLDLDDMSLSAVMSSQEIEEREVMEWREQAYQRLADLHYPHPLG